MKWNSKKIYLEHSRLQIILWKHGSAQTSTTWRNWIMLWIVSQSSQGFSGVTWGKNLALNEVGVFCHSNTWRGSFLHKCFKHSSQFVISDLTYPELHSVFLGWVWWLVGLFHVCVLLWYNCRYIFNCFLPIPSASPLPLSLSFFPFLSPSISAPLPFLSVSPSFCVCHSIHSSVNAHPLGSSSPAAPGFPVPSLGLQECIFQ